MTAFLYNSRGQVIAFRRSPDDRYLFDKSGNWIGWFPWGDDDAVTTSGQYLGTVIGSRLLRRRSQGYRGYPGYPGYPGYAGYPGYPGFAGYSPLPAGYEDVAAID
jgi:hypothetical protein